MINLLRASDDQRWYRASLGALVLSAWLALVVWGASPYAGLLSHTATQDGTVPLTTRLALFVVGWTLMTVAMMLPASLPLVNLFRGVVRQRSNASALLALLIVGYLSIWAAFGLLAYLGDGLLHLAVAQSPLLQARPDLIAAAVLLLAGAYQFSQLKELCLSACRSPLSFLSQHWTSAWGRPGALWLGVRHGLFCLGCCWALMLLLFAVGGISLVWMLGLGALMAAERTIRRGRRLTRPLGLLLIAWSGLHLAGLLTT